MQGSVEIATEREGKACWVFEICRNGESISTLTLSWADYDWWSPDGRHTPSQVAHAVVKVWQCARSPDGGENGIPAKFDASTIRRRVADADRLISEQLEVTL